MKKPKKKTKLFFDRSLKFVVHKKNKKYIEAIEKLNGEITLLMWSKMNQIETVIFSISIPMEI